MSEIRIRNTGEVMTDITFRTTFKDRLLPTSLTAEWLNGFAGGCDIVFEGPQTTGGTVYQYSQRSGIEQQSDGKWYTKNILGPVFTDRAAEGDRPAQTAAEQEAAYKAMKDAEQAASVRSSRDSTLAQSDWRVIKAVELSTAVPIEWAAYRQALRDVTAQTGFPWTITWPEQPK